VVEGRIYPVPAAVKSNLPTKSNGYVAGTKQTVTKQTVTKQKERHMDFLIESQAVPTGNGVLAFRGVVTLGGVEIYKTVDLFDSPHEAMKAVKSDFLFRLSDLINEIKR
jgi:hypothetical protein